MALCGTEACDPVDVLPPPLVRAVFTRLPADQRARAACVCRGWRAALADPSLWECLDLTREGGVVCRIDDRALRAAAARARGGLLKLSVPICPSLYAALRAMVAANTTNLVELCFVGFADYSTFLSHDDSWEQFKMELLALLALVPTLQVLKVSSFHTDFSDSLRVLRNQPPYGPLRVQWLQIDGEPEDTDISSLATHVVAHKSLTKLSLHFAREQAGCSTSGA